MSKYNRKTVAYPVVLQAAETTVLTEFVGLSVLQQLWDALGGPGFWRPRASTRDLPRRRRPRIASPSVCSRGFAVLRSGGRRNGLGARGRPRTGPFAGGLSKPRYSQRAVNRFFLLVTNQRTWTARHIVRLFSCRPVIEQTHRTGKQPAGWNDFHTRSLVVLRCHLALCLLRTTLLGWRTFYRHCGSIHWKSS